MIAINENWLSFSSSDDDIGDSYNQNIAVNFTFYYETSIVKQNAAK